MINKNKNILIQITLSKANSEKLESIANYLNDFFNMQLTKSQVINYLINNYKVAESKQNKKIQAKESNQDLRAKLLLLRQQYNLSYPTISELSNIPVSTLKKYGLGQQEPKGENLTKLIKLFNDYKLN